MCIRTHQNSKKKYIFFCFYHHEAFDLYYLLLHNRYANNIRFIYCIISCLIKNYPRLKRKNSRFYNKFRRIYRMYRHYTRRHGIVELVDDSMLYGFIIF